MKYSKRRFFIILFLSLISFYISLPSNIPIHIHQKLGFLQNKEVNFDKDVARPGLDVSLGNFSLKRDFDLKLGLDLSGGSHLVFEADTSTLGKEDVADAVEAARSTIEKRVNIFGVSEAQVSTSKVGGSNRVVVDLPGVHESQKAIQLIGQTAQLDFRELANHGEATKAGVYVNYENTKSTGFTGSDLKRARPSYDSTTGKPIVSFEIKPESSQKFGDITTRLTGQRLFIFLDGIPRSGPTVNGPITGGQGQITGEFTSEETKELAGLLNSGALPVPIHLIEQRTVEASLGEQAVSASVVGGLVGLAMVVFFMIANYGRLGFLATISLFVYALISLAIYKLIPIVLTLPGVAGLILSIGMAVDSNILIFERLKEEVRLGKSWENSLEAAFGRAWDSIRDANIATLLTVFILFNPFNFSFLHTSGPVRGFALTLGLGVALSLFTGIYVTRTLLRLFAKKVNSTE